MHGCFIKDDCSIRIYRSAIYTRGAKSDQAIAGPAPTALICPDVRYAQNEPLALQGHKVYFNCYVCMHVMLKPMEMHKGTLLIVYQTVILVLVQVIAE